MRRILAIGGGGFLNDPVNHAMEEHLLTLAAASEPKVCFLPTASGDPGEQIARFDATFGDLDCRRSHVSLFRLGHRPLDLGAHLLAQDVIYVGGGSMENLLAIWRVHGLDRILREAWRRGTVLAGISAGSMCWFDGGITTSHGAPRAVAGLGLLSGSNSVHYDSEPQRRPCFLQAVQRGLLPPGYGVDDGAALQFAGAGLEQVVSSVSGAGAVRVQPDLAGEVCERPLPVTKLVHHRDEVEEPFAIGELRRLREFHLSGGRSR